MSNKVGKIKKWLDDGAVVCRVGSRDAAIWRSGGLYHWKNYGSSAVKADTENLKRLLTKVFSDTDEFYIINLDKQMECTDFSIAHNCNTVACEWEFYDRDDAETSRPFLRYNATITRILQEMWSVTENFNSDFGTNHVRIECKRKNWGDLNDPTKHYVAPQFSRFWFAV